MGGPLQLDPDHFFARYKLAGLFHSLQALPSAEAETLKALDVAGTQSEVALARQQLLAIRESMQQEENLEQPAPLRFRLIWT